LTFPPNLPADRSNPRVIRENDWDAFRQVGLMENHWERPGWTDGRRSFHWMLTFRNAVAVHELAADCQKRFARADLDHVDTETLHITLGRIGFTDEISRAKVDDLSSYAASRCGRLSRFAVHVGPLAGSRGALRFSVTPWTPLIELHRAISHATRDVLGQDEVMDTSRFRPHLSIAYSNRRVSVADLLPQVEQCRSLAPVVTDISAVSVVELRRERSAYKYEELQQINLGHG
jgi:2'-5' RNA ligase